MLRLSSVSLLVLVLLVILHRFCSLQSRSLISSITLRQCLPEAVLRSALEKQYPKADAGQITGAMSRSGGYLGQAMAIMEESEDASATTVSFLKAYAAADAVALAQVLVPMEKWKRDVLVPELERWLTVLADALAARSGRTPTQPMAEQIAAARSGGDLMNGINALQKAIDYTRRNISPGAVCGYLQWELR